MRMGPVRAAPCRTLGVGHKRFHKCHIGFPIPHENIVVAAPLKDVELFGLWGGGMQSLGVMHGHQFVMLGVQNQRAPLKGAKLVGVVEMRF